MNTPTTVAGRARKSTKTQYRLAIPISSKHIMGIPHHTMADAKRCGNVFMGLEVRVSFMFNHQFTLSSLHHRPICRVIGT
jgi:hypothetical protein